MNANDRNMMAEAGETFLRTGGQDEVRRWLLGVKGVGE